MRSMPVYWVALRGAGKERYQQLLRRVRGVMSLLLLVLAFATSGLYLLDDPAASVGSRLLNALWNSTNALTTLGDFTDFDLRQKLFILTFMALFLVVGAYSVSNLAGVLSSPEVVTFRENRSMEKRLATLSGHVIVAGYGDTGALVAQRLRDQGETVVVIDDAEENARAASDAGYLAVHGMAEHEETLDAARVASAKAMLIEVTAPAESGRKLSMILMARAMNASLYISVLSTTPRGRNWFAHAGANEVLYIDSLIAAAVVDRYAKAAAPPDGRG
jgi:hypothetical protein